MQLNTDALRAIRERSGWTQASLADVTGIPPETLSRLENGRRPGTPPQIKALAVALKVPVTAIISDCDHDIEAWNAQQNAARAAQVDAPANVVDADSAEVLCPASMEGNAAELGGGLLRVALYLKEMQSSAVNSPGEVPE